MAQEYAAGYIGIVIFGGVDMNVTEWDATITTEWAETTNTSNYDVASLSCWESSIPTTRKAAGSFTVFVDKNNFPNTSFRDGTVATCDLTAQVGHHITGPVAIDSINYRQGGVKGVISAVVNWHSAGTMTIT